MSSLIQHHGTTKAGKVELLMYLQCVEKSAHCSECGYKQSIENTTCEHCNRQFRHRFRLGQDMQTLVPYTEKLAGYPPLTSAMQEAFISERESTHESEPQELTRPNGTKAICPKLYRIWRKPCGMFGCWVVFRYNGKKQVPDLSVPISLNVLPRDAEELTEQEAIAYWFKQS